HHGNIRLRQREAQPHHDRAAHAAPEIEVAVVVTGGGHVVGGGAETADRDHALASFNRPATTARRSRRLVLLISRIPLPRSRAATAERRSACRRCRPAPRRPRRLRALRPPDGRAGLFFPIARTRPPGSRPPAPSRD